MLRRRSLWCWFAFLPLLVAIAIVPSKPLRAAGELERENQIVARKILDKLRSSNAKTVGVLKFSVRVGQGQFPTSVGTLNMRLAEKLELALVMANPASESQALQQVGVVRAASDVADTIPNASHLTPDGRRLLFTKQYPLTWQFQNQSQATPDSFVVGIVQVDAGLRKMDIELLLLLKSDLELHPIAQFSVPTDLDDLLDSGESFSTRGIFDNGTVTESDKKVELIAKKSLEIRQETQGKSQPQPSQLHPLAPQSTSPVKLEVLYGNQLQPYEFRDGAAFVREPKEREKVTFVVRRKSPDKKRYGVLIRVNGENTLYRERTPDVRSALWILEPNLDAFSVNGFQIDNNNRQEFRVLSETESQQRTIDYGRDVGLISLVVYEESKGTPPVLSEEELDLAVQSQATLPAKPSSTRGQLGKSLFDQLLAQDGTRGLIAEGETRTASINTVQFQREPIPVMAASIRYYRVR